MGHFDLMWLSLEERIVVAVVVVACIMTILMAAATP